jgi:hypothetical protein
MAQASGTEQGGKHRWKANKTPWVSTVSGQIEHAHPGSEAPKGLGHRGKAPRHLKAEKPGGGR